MFRLSGEERNSGTREEGQLHCTEAGGVTHNREYVLADVLRQTLRLYSNRPSARLHRLYEEVSSFADHHVWRWRYLVERADLHSVTLVSLKGESRSMRKKLIG